MIYDPLPMFLRSSQNPTPSCLSISNISVMMKISVIVMLPYVV